MSHFEVLRSLHVLASSPRPRCPRNISAPNTVVCAMVLISLLASGWRCEGREPSEGHSGIAAQVALIKEGAADATALLGIIRLAAFLSRPEQLGTDEPRHIFVDSGTGATATGEDSTVICLRVLKFDVHRRC